MTTEKMTIHEALSELKVLNSRINKEIRDTEFDSFMIHYFFYINGLKLHMKGVDIK